MRVLGALLVATMMLTGCGGGGGGGGSKPSTPPPTPTPPAPESNVAKIQVGAGPYGVVNLPMVSVTVCAPGDAAQCHVIDNVLLDTGSVGLRVVGSVLASKAPNLQLPVVQVGQPASPLYSCIGFIDGSYAWGGIHRADVKIAGLTASNIPIQVIGDTPFSGARPSECTGLHPSLDNSVAANLGANGILGVNYYVEDCGSYCINATHGIPLYVTCSINTCGYAGVPLAQQVKNPVAAFPTDNNGLLVQLPAVSANGSSSVSGSLIFGIGTRANNGLGSAHLFDGYELTTRYKEVTNDNAFIDSGSNALYFDDATIPRCINSIFFCPASTQGLSAVIGDDTSYTQEIAFNVASMNSLVNSGNFAFDNLAAFYSSPFQGRMFDWGLPFFFGRTVYFGMENTVYEDKVGF